MHTVGQMDDHPQGMPGDLEAVGRYTSEREALRHATVILAMRGDCWLAETGPWWLLLVRPSLADRASLQLSRYDSESLRPPPPREQPMPVAGRMDYPPALLWALFTAACFWLQSQAPGLWETLGCMDSRALFQRGEWWRPATALLLHADYAHLAANLASGLFTFAALRTAFSRGTAWTCLALSSIAANVLAGLVQLGSDYRSLGASTAVFAGLGLLTGRATRHALSSASTHKLRHLIVPLASGLSLLALFGAGDLRTDITAHLCGFACGLALGAMLPLPERSDTVA